MNEVEQNIANYIAQKIMLKKDRSALGPDDQLLETGIIDSAAMVELLLFLETEYGIQVPAREVVPENFENVRAIASLVKSLTTVKSQ